MDRQWEREEEQEKEEEEEIVAQKSHKYQLVPRRRFHGPFDTVALGLSGCSNTPERIVSPLSLPFTLLALSFDELFGQVDRCPAASFGPFSGPDGICGRRVMYRRCLFASRSDPSRLLGPRKGARLVRNTDGYRRESRRRIVRMTSTTIWPRTGLVLSRPKLSLASLIRAKCGQAWTSLIFLQISFVEKDVQLWIFFIIIWESSYDSNFERTSNLIGE